MKPAEDPGVDYTDLVRRGYDRCAVTFAAARREGNPAELTLLTSRLGKGASVLDLGCGSGVPVTRALAEQFRVTGVDFSAEQLRIARGNVASAEFIQGDIRTVELGLREFDAVVAFYAIFHLPREQHFDLFRRIRGWLRTGGFLLATVSALSEPPYTEEDFFGVPMYWSHFSQGEYLSMLTTLGFTLLDASPIGHGYGPAYRGPEERHPLVFAQKAIARRCEQVSRLPVPQPREVPR